MDKALDVKGKEHGDQQDYQSLGLEGRVLIYQGLDQYLVDLTNSLAGVRSKVNYVAMSARGLTQDDSAMDDYVRNYSENGIISDHDIYALSRLDSTKYKKRDNEKMNMISRAMEQYIVDIESLRAHITIAIGLVSQSNMHINSGVIADLKKVSNFDASAQNALTLGNMRTDSSKMSMIATLTVLLLPGTSLAVRYQLLEDARTV